MDEPTDKKIKVLIVEDERNVGDLLKEILADDGRTIRLSRDGTEALNELRRARYDLVITDIMLPGATGMEVLREAKKRHPRTLVIIITGYASIETAIEAIRDGAYDYLRKPFRLDEIKIAVNNACEKITLTRENSLLIHNLKEAYGELKKLSRDEKASRETGANGAGRSDSAVSSMEIFPRNVIPPSFFEGQEGTKRIMGDLERIVRLKNAGLLDDEEFSACKKLLLDMIK